MGQRSVNKLVISPLFAEVLSGELTDFKDNPNLRTLGALSVATYQIGHRHDSSDLSRITDKLLLSPNVQVSLLTELNPDVSYPAREETIIIERLVGIELCNTVNSTSLTFNETRLPGAFPLRIAGMNNLYYEPEDFNLLDEAELSEARKRVTEAANLFLDY